MHSHRNELLWKKIRPKLGNRELDGFECINHLEASRLYKLFAFEMYFSEISLKYDGVCSKCEIEQEYEMCVQVKLSNWIAAIKCIFQRSSNAPWN